MAKYVYTKKRKAAQRKATRKWSKMSKRARASLKKGGRGKIRNR